MTRLKVATRDTFRSLQHRNFRIFFIAQGISFTGTWLQLAAQTLLVYRLTGSGTALGVLTAIQFTPTLLLGAWAGVVVDRHDKRRIITIASTVMGVAATVLAVLVITDRVTLGAVYVLAAMHRGYTADRYLRRLAEARAVVADLAVTTDIIVGFPGETGADFERTLEVTAAAEFDSAYTFLFSPRPGTEAATMADRFVDPAVAGARFDRLKVVVERSALAKHRARIGRHEEVLIEGPSKKDPAVVTARTRQSKLVHLAADDQLSPGTYALAQIVDAAPHHLRGRLVEVLARPSHRRRIPVLAG